MDKKKRLSIITFIIGLLVLISGITFLIIKIVNKQATPDGEFLVSIDQWKEQDSDNVIWEFIDQEKGTLTTNNHTNDYDFTWIIEDNKLKIKTAWLYDLTDEFDYSINQNSKTLKISKDGKEIVFIPAKN